MCYRSLQALLCHEKITSRSHVFKRSLQTLLCHEKLLIPVVDKCHYRVNPLVSHCSSDDDPASKIVNIRDEIPLIIILIKAYCNSNIKVDLSGRDSGLHATASTKPNVSVLHICIINSIHAFFFRRFSAGFTIGGG